jgi:hypothetical protein
MGRSLEVDLGCIRGEAARVGVCHIGAWIDELTLKVTPRDYLRDAMDTLFDTLTERLPELPRDALRLLRHRFEHK